MDRPRPNMATRPRMAQEGRIVPALRDVRQVPEDRDHAVLPAVVRVRPDVLLARVELQLGPVHVA